MNENSRIGFIYSITGYGLTYIGSTIQPICERKSTHKSQHKRWIERNREGWKCASYDILDKGDEWEIKVLETILTDTNKVGLLEREQHYIKISDCVNKIQAIQSIEDLKEYKRKWAEKNRREKGIQPKAEGFDAKKYARDWARAKRASLTEEEREAINAKRREVRKTKNEMTDK